jgi:hypothetical protein
MSKRDFSFLVIGAVLAYGVFVFEVPRHIAEYLDEPTVAEIEETIAQIEWEQMYQRREMRQVLQFSGPGSRLEKPCTPKFEPEWSSPECKWRQYRYEEREYLLEALQLQLVKAQLRERE